jgi:hypothetical protein
LQNRTRAVIAGALFFGLAAAFNVLNLYDRWFFSARQLDQIAYNAARLVFVLFLFEITFALGQWLLVALRRRGVAFDVTPAEELAISLVCGSAVLRLAMLALGFAGLYYWWLMAAGGTIAVALGWSSFVRLISAWAVSAYRTSRESHPLDRFAAACLLLLMFAATGYVVAEKMILPNGTGDFYTHYFPYMQQVVVSHNIWPNDVWYHFFSSKAFGDSFFAMLTSGPLGMQAASCCMFFVALVVMFVFIEGATGDGLVALAAVAITASGLIWTIDFTEWGEFSKEHVITAGVFFGCVWASWRSLTIPPQQQRWWAALVSLAYCSLIVMRIELAPVALAVLVVLAAWELLSRRREHLAGFCMQLGTVLVSTVAVLTLNYAVTGLAEITPFRLFWSFADQAKFAHWVSPFLMMMLQLGSSAQMGTITAPYLGQGSLHVLYQVLHFDRAAPFMGPAGATFALVVAISVYAIFRGSVLRRGALLSALAILSVMLAASALAALATLSQFVSIFRLYMFCMLPVIALAALPFAIARAALPRLGAAVIGAIVAVQVLVGINAATATSFSYRDLVGRFLIGQVSIANADFQSNALYPPKLAMAIAAGGKPIWDSQIRNYCAAPECRFESFFSFSLGPNWHTIAFGSPDEAEAALKAAGVDYFSVDASQPFFDILPYAPLFSPHNIAEHFSLAWARDGIYLLTWRSPGLQTIPPEFYTDYEQSKKLGVERADFKGMYDVLDAVYRQWKASGQKWPIQLPAGLALPRGWQ